ncbi:unnamed protein product [Echinostoma caproni]|uniref:ML domain-containing protein n=1 Tax=Echinostoma caproni TaxID=27848 RepID=A0A183AU35_9TREM|nr:unnamed protein product [Echinostoma caproni]
MVQVSWTSAFSLIGIYLISVECSKFKDCGSALGSIHTLDIEPCDTTPCTLYKGENATIRIKFDSKKRVDQATVAVHGIIAHIPVPFPLDDSNVCHFVQPSCPLIPDQGPYTYEFKLFVQHQFPSIRLVIRWEFKTTDSEDVICAEFPAQLNTRSHRLNSMPEQVPMMRLTPAKKRPWLGSN